MGFCDSGSSDHLILCKAALIFGVTRCIFSWAQKLVKHYMCIFSWSLELFPEPTTISPQPCSGSSSVLSMVKEHLSLTSFEEIAKRRIPDHDQEEENHDMSCAVCLKRFKKKNQVWELSNCSHVFHEDCLNRWLLYDARLSCPLCRTSLITTLGTESCSDSSSSSSTAAAANQQPSWAVERILYLFGDDLLCSDQHRFSCLDSCYT
ncbi:OLC1v1025585C1 [Oldenlandia corymbosa var. corymbosa]|uniref:OLC1v1025585C1 n=1 Tax=Oldenlandia corymbosa var. corymbosa TaxID=529605 RepID=A0AAV1C6L8_OLDCO|nr:OLC1v1025585C1 [Oldenlandia corymbosa var. corymbosa]